jgi:hypothetical protein
MKEKPGQTCRQREPHALTISNCPRPCQKEAVRKPHDLHHTTRLSFCINPLPSRTASPTRPRFSRSLHSSLSLYLFNLTPNRQPPAAGRRPAPEAAPPAATSAAREDSASRGPTTSAAGPLAPPLEEPGPELARRTPPCPYLSDSSRCALRAGTDPAPADERRDVRIGAWT